jgi:hypothetical protein
MALNEELKALRQGYKLGKLAPKIDARTLKLENYVAVGTPAAPKEVDWTCGQKSWGMMLNDTLGDCTCAAAGHAIQVWTQAAHFADGETFEKTEPDSAILTAYEAVSGYNPVTGDNDNGAVMLDVLNCWRKTGVGGDTVAAFASIALHQGSTIPMAQLALDWFGGLYIGLQLPLSAQDETVWSQGFGAEGQAGSWGGHCVYVVGYDGGGLTCITWGGLQRMTWGFFSTYCDEAYAVLDSADWLEGTGKAPSGLNLAQLQADLKVVTG